ncbi:alpha/beta hydrolase family protein [Nocardiopsis algeriensis]|uniref:Pimeloyl-ACP methyl ester carboxylesterase n=1 Tax=Nocardiopsis algeriensis TaxID=1478215 RepID=A0A841IW56_9ACTN|nr:alpha/beta hydrolase [Nocardiopsis algeriensis]MBB6120428.1 pimeloyl-ACP methyl ester carboxylesterase [Nocardiopsis algeriensis]
MSDALDFPITRSRRYWLTTADGVGIDSQLLTGPVPRTTAVVLANGFTGTYRSPHTRALAEAMLQVGDVMTFDFRGHHGSGGRSTVGNAEIHDLEAVMVRLRELGYTSVATVGFSMGAAVVVRHAAVYGGVAAAVAVSGPSRWYYRGTRRMRLLHLGVERGLGRFFLRSFRKVRVIDREWETRPAEPREVAGKISPAPLLVVHGDADPYFPVSHALDVHGAAEEPKDLWIIPGMGHAERAVTPELSLRLREWLREHLPEEQAEEN